MPNPPPYYLQWLLKEFEKKVDKNSRFSLRSFARLVELDSGSLSQIMKAKRVPSERIAKKILSKFEISEEEKTRFWSSLAQAQHQRSLMRMNPVFRKLAQKSSQESWVLLDQDALQEVASVWYYPAILELVDTIGFKSDPAWIAGELDISLEILTHSRNLKAAQEMIAFAQENLDNALLAYEGVLNKYQAGHISIAELSNALRQLAMARLRQSEIQTRYYGSMANLAYATGTLPPYVMAPCDD